MRKIIYTVFLLLIGHFVLAQNSSREFVRFSEDKEKYNVKVSDGTYRIVFYTSDIVETTFIPQKESFVNKSHAVVMDPEQPQTVVAYNQDFINIKSASVTVKIQKEPFQISYYKDEELIISETRGYMKDSLEKIQFNLAEEEALYGGG